MIYVTIYDISHLYEREDLLSSTKGSKSLNINVCSSLAIYIAGWVENYSEKDTAAYCYCIVFKKIGLLTFWVWFTLSQLIFHINGFQGINISCRPVQLYYDENEVGSLYCEVINSLSESAFQECLVKRASIDLIVQETSTVGM